MPELPEVETTVKSLNILKNKKVINLDIHIKKLRYLIPLIKLKKMLEKFNFSQVIDLQNSSRTSFYRKYLLNISNSKC